MTARSTGHAGVSTIRGGDTAPGVLCPGWEYLTTVASGVQGESWYHIANRRPSEGGW